MRTENSYTEFKGDMPHDKPREGEAKTQCADCDPREWAHKHDGQTIPLCDMHWGMRAVSKPHDLASIGEGDASKLERMYRTVAPMVDEMRRRYPMNMDGLEPALTTDIAAICLKVEARARDAVKTECGRMMVIGEDSAFKEGYNEALEDVIGFLSAPRE